MANHVTFTHGRAHFTVTPQNAHKVREALAALESAKPRKPRLAPQRSAYPQFKPGMTTAEYIRQFHNLNSGEHWTPVGYVHADRAAPMLNPLFPEAAEEIDPDYVEPVKPAKRRGKAVPAEVVAVLREALSLMPLGTAIRAEWMRRASDVLSKVAA